MFSYWKYDYKISKAKKKLGHVSIYKMLFKKLDVIQSYSDLHLANFVIKISLVIDIILDFYFKKPGKWIWFYIDYQKI